MGGKKLFAQSSTELILYSGKKFAIKSIIKHENEVHKKPLFLPRLLQTVCTGKNGQCCLL